VSRSISRGLAVLALALGALAAADARAVSFGPYPIIYPSTIQNQDLTIELTPTGTIAFDIANVPYTTPQLFELTDVSVNAGSFHFTLDPTLTSPALGVIQPDGHFLIPTLFLVGDDGSGAFDLAIPNVQGFVFGAPEFAVGFSSQFQIDAGADLFTVSLYVNAPEPGTALLLACGCTALALRTRKEIAR